MGLSLSLSPHPSLGGRDRREGGEATSSWEERVADWAPKSPSQSLLASLTPLFSGQGRKETRRCCKSPLRRPIHPREEKKKEAEFSSSWAEKRGEIEALHNAAVAARGVDTKRISNAVPFPFLPLPFFRVLVQFPIPRKKSRKEKELVPRACRT